MGILVLSGDCKSNPLSVPEIDSIETFDLSFVANITIHILRKEMASMINNVQQLRLRMFCRGDFVLVYGHAMPIDFKLAATRIPGSRTGFIPMNEGESVPILRGSPPTPCE